MIWEINNKYILLERPPNDEITDSLMVTCLWLLKNMGGIDWYSVTTYKILNVCNLSLPSFSMDLLYTILLLWVWEGNKYTLNLQAKISSSISSIGRFWLIVKWWYDIIMVVNHYHIKVPVFLHQIMCHEVVFVKSKETFLNSSIYP